MGTKCKGTQYFIRTILQALNLQMSKTPPKNAQTLPLRFSGGKSLKKQGCGLDSALQQSHCNRLHHHAT
jgi:hypothetical protein